MTPKQQKLLLDKLSSGINDKIQIKTIESEQSFFDEMTYDEFLKYIHETTPQDFKDLLSELNYDECVQYETKGIIPSRLGTKYNHYIGAITSNYKK